MKLNNLNGVFIHPCLREYRIELFNSINELLSIDVIENSYPASGKHVSKERLDSLSKAEFNVIEQTNKIFLNSKNSDTSIFKALDKKYDFIIFSSFISMPFIFLAFLSKLKGKKVFVFDEIWEYPSTIKFKIIKPLFKIFVYFFVDGFILSGSKAYDFNKKFFPYIKKRVKAVNTHKSTIKNGIENERHKDILYLGRVVEIKALDKLIEALKNTNYKLTVVGDGDFLPYCKDLVDKLELTHRVEFMGACEKDEVEGYFREHKIFCLPSKFVSNKSQQLESWGFTVNEALSYGCKVLVSSRVGSAHDLVHDGFNGYIFDVDTPSDFIEKLNLVHDELLPPSEINKMLNRICDNKSNARNITDMISKLY